MVRNAWTSLKMYPSPNRNYSTRFYKLVFKHDVMKPEQAPAWQKMRNRFSEKLNDRRNIIKSTDRHEICLSRLKSLRTPARIISPKMWFWKIKRFSMASINYNYIYTAPTILLSATLPFTNYVLTPKYIHQCSDSIFLLSDIITFKSVHRYLVRSYLGHFLLGYHSGAGTLSFDGWEPNFSKPSAHLSYPSYYSPRPFPNDNTYSWSFSHEIQFIYLSETTTDPNPLSPVYWQNFVALLSVEPISNFFAIFWLSWSHWRFPFTSMQTRYSTKLKALSNLFLNQIC